MSRAPGGQGAIDLDAVMQAVAACPSVIRVSAGAFGQAVTHLPGHRVYGVRIVDGAVEVHVVVRWVPFLPDVADEVRSALVPLVGTGPIHVFIDDVSTEDARPDALVGDPATQPAGATVDAFSEYPSGG